MGLPGQDRRDVLLKAALELLKKAHSGPCVNDILTETVFYDGVDCDGACLANDIAIYYDEDEPY